MRRRAHRARRARWLVAGVVMLALAATGFYVLLWRDREPGPASLSDAVDRFQATSTSVDSGGETTRPPDGVYEYEGEGREHISLPPTTQHDGATMPATVTHEEDGCWTFRLDYNEGHWQTWRYCPRDDGLASTGGETFQAWDLGFMSVSNLSTFACDPPNVTLPPEAEPGEEWPEECRGTNEQVPGETVTAGPRRFVGRETLAVGGVDVETWRFHVEHEVSGAQTGTEESEWWIAPNGLPVRQERSFRVESDSPVGTITYTEEGSWRLTSLEPES